MNDYVPFMDLHPELNLVPTTSVNININLLDELNLLNIYA